MALGEHLRDVGYEAVDCVRRAHGRWPLTRDDQIAWNAGLHAGWLAQVDRCEHARPESLGSLRENVWCGRMNMQPEDIVRDAILCDWMRDDAHRWNLLDEGLSKIGIGIHAYRDECRGLFYIALVCRFSH